LSSYSVRSRVAMVRVAANALPFVSNIRGLPPLTKDMETRMSVLESTWEQNWSSA